MMMLMFMHRATYCLSSVIWLCYTGNSFSLIRYMAKQAEELKTTISKVNSMSLHNSNEGY